MINWTALLTNAIWLLALSAALAIAGWASWQAALEKTRFLVVLQRRGTALALQGCLAVFCLGVALSVQATWERVAWALLTVLSVIQLAAAYRSFFNAKTQRRKD
jgi:hypothetical protein